MQSAQARAAQLRVTQFEHGWRDNIAKEELAERQAWSPFSTAFKPVDATFYNDYNDMDYDTIATRHFGVKPTMPAPGPARASRKQCSRSTGRVAQARLEKLQKEVAECKRQHQVLRKQALAVSASGSSHRRSEG